MDAPIKLISQLNFFDYLLIIIFIFYIVEEASSGAVLSFFRLFPLVFSFLVTIIFYPILSEKIMNILPLDKSASDALAFSIIGALAFAVGKVIFTKLKVKTSNILFPKTINLVGGAFFGFVSLFIFASFFITFFLSLPISNLLKEQIRSSIFTKTILVQFYIIESNMRYLVGEEQGNGMNVLTIPITSKGSSPLKFTAKIYEVDKKDESKVLEVVNREREKYILPIYVRDKRLDQVARNHAIDMISKGYISHSTQNGFTLFDRLASNNIFYQTASEAIVFTQSVELALAAILNDEDQAVFSPSFKKIGIAGVNVGTFGKMYVLVFTD